MPLCASTCTVPSVNVAVPPTASLLACPAALALTAKVELAAKAALPVTVRVPMAVPATAPGATNPPLMTLTSPLMVPCPTSWPPEFTVTFPVSFALA